MEGGFKTEFLYLYHCSELFRLKETYECRFFKSTILSILRQTIVVSSFVKPTCRFGNSSVENVLEMHIIILSEISA